jgi:lipoprotein-releasing system permease protein
MSTSSKESIITPNMRIAVRFLMSRKRAMLMSLAGIVFGVGFFVVTQANTSGFESFFIQTILGTEGALRVQDRMEETLRVMEVEDEETNSKTLVEMQDGYKIVAGIDNPAGIIESVKQFEGVVGVSEVLRGRVSLETASRQRDVEPYGIDLENHQIVLGSLEDFRSNPLGIIVGQRLASRLDINVGDPIFLNYLGERTRFRVSGIFETGVGDIDMDRVFIHLREARSLMRRPNGASFLQVSLQDPQLAPQVAAHMKQVLGHWVASWQERERAWIEVFRALRVSSAITVSIIILISGLGMFNTLVMIVMEKHREIAILRSMGYTRKDISSIFLWQGFMVLFVGTALGWLFGAVVTYLISKMPIRIRGIFSTDSFVVNWDMNHYYAAAIVATVVVMVASYFPARRAARLEPGAIIRGSSS